MCRTAKAFLASFLFTNTEILISDVDITCIFIFLFVHFILSSSAYASNESIKKDGFVIPTNRWKDKIKIDADTTELVVAIPTPCDPPLE